MNRIVVLVMIIAFFFAACGEEEKVSYRLTSKERRQVDTLVSRRVKIMRPYIDSLCTANFETKVAAATDSIVQLRLEEEVRLRNRIPLERKSGQ